MIKNTLYIDGNIPIDIDQAESKTASRWEYFKQMSPTTVVEPPKPIVISPKHRHTQYQLPIIRNMNYTQRYKIDMNYCKNCGKQGHMFHKCKMPITSIGIIAFYIDTKYIPKTVSQTAEGGGGGGGEPEVNITGGEIRYLMICRKDSLGYIDFIRGKYMVQDKEYIMSMFKQMSLDEKRRILENDFDTLWNLLWGETAGLNQYKTEKQISRENFNQLRRGIFTPLKIYNETPKDIQGQSSPINELNRHASLDVCPISNLHRFKGDENAEPTLLYNLETMIEESRAFPEWLEPEWGFPKGRRNHLENEYTCALREFQEETGYASNLLINIQNIIPVEEVFVGSNLKTYKHKYYLMMMNLEDSTQIPNFQKTEVSKMEWKTLDECLAVIRPYNVEKRKIIQNAHSILTHYHLFLPVG